MTDQLLPLLDQQLSHLQSLHQVMKNEELLLGYPRVPQSPFQEATEQKRFLVAAIGHNETRRQALEQEAGCVHLMTIMKPCTLSGMRLKTLL